jgi:hypothetical protein
VGIQGVRQDRGATKPTGKYTFLYGMGNENDELGSFPLSIRELYQQVRDLSLIVIQCSFCDTALNIHDSTKDETIVKDSFYMEL